MFTRLRERLSGVSSRVVVAVALIALIVVTGVALLFLRSGENVVDADTSVEPRAARIDRVDGSVAIARVVENEEPDWAEATTNTPVTVGDRIYARSDSRASIALTGRNYVELKPDASLDVLSLEEAKTQLALRGGSALFDIGELDQSEAFEVATPGGAVNFVEAGLYQIGIDGDDTVISVLSGRAQVVGLGGSEYISKGQVFTLAGASSTQALASTLEPELAGNIVDNHYRYRYPKTYDGRYADYDAYLEDPDYYDPYEHSESYRYVSADIPGVDDLDYYGDWTEIDGYGHCWSPRVSADWAPFRHGRWDIDRLWGMTWVSHEPWGWTPYHYGRWAHVNQRWFWVPVQVSRRPTYCPAPVAFISLAHTNQIAWVPLAPGEEYAPRYYDRHFQPRYLASREVIREIRNRRAFANWDAPSGVTVVNVQSLRRGIDPRVIAKVDSREIARHQHTLDPLEVADVRQLAIRKEGARHKIKLERGERDVWNRTVVTSTKTPSLPDESNSAKAFRVEQVSEGRKRNKLKIDQTGQVVSARRRDDLPQPMVQANKATDAAAANERQQKMAALAARSNQGDQSARRELRQLKQEDKRARREQAKASGQPVQSSSNQQQAAQMRQQQMRQQMKEQQRQQSGAAQQNQARQQQMRQQQKEQRRIVRQQQKSPVPQQQQPVRKEQTRVRQTQKAPAQQERPKPVRRKPPEVPQQTQRVESMRQEQMKQARGRAQMEAARQAQQQNQMKAQQQRRVVERQNRPPVNRIPVMKQPQQPRVDQPRQQIKPQPRQQQPTQQQTKSRPRKPGNGA